MLSWLASVNKATVAAIVTFICATLLPTFFQITVPGEVQAGIVAVLVWLIPNVETTT